MTLEQFFYTFSIGTTCVVYISAGIVGYRKYKQLKKENEAIQEFNDAINEPQYPIRTFEYKTLKVEDTNNLDAELSVLGNEEWELVSFIQQKNIAVFKRDKLV